VSYDDGIPPRQPYGYGKQADLGMKVRSCDLCGAVTGISPDEGEAGVNNWDRHARWHQDQDELFKFLCLASCSETQDRMAAIIAKGEAP
jgi:hypothetical protein